MHNEINEIKNTDWPPITTDKIPNNEYCLYNGALLRNLLVNTSFIAEHTTGNTAADTNKPNNASKSRTNSKKRSN